MEDFAGTRTITDARRLRQIDGVLPFFDNADAAGIGEQRFPSSSSVSCVPLAIRKELRRVTGAAGCGDRISITG